jgi:hypothetical protein
MTAPLPPQTPANRTPQPALWIALAGIGGLLMLAGGIWAATTVGAKVKTAVFGMPHVWVGTDDTSAFMIQITRQGNALSGTLDETSLDNPSSTTVTPLHAAFTGMIDGSAITLNFSAGLGFVNSISGTLSGDTMTLQAPQSNGSVAPVTLRPASVDAYNRRSAAVQASATANANASAATAAAAADAAARERTQQQISQAAQTVAADMKALRDAVGQSPDFSGFDKQVADARNYLDQAKSYAAKAATESERSTACDNAHASRDEQHAVQDAAHGVDDETNGIGDTIRSVNVTADHLSKDLADYRQTAAAMPTYTPANPPDAGTIQSLLDEASKQTSAWKGKATQYQNQVAQLVAQADNVATQAEKQFC